MKQEKTAKSLSDLLRDCLHGPEPLRKIARATGMPHTSLMRFKAGETSLRLDLADKLAEYFGIVHVRKEK